MGVTLERVQNKFACIIGELCNEPDVLSQFAIWVDMRMAEYKAKGFISLDCSGDSPTPTWLRGYQPPVISRERTLPGSPPRDRRTRENRVTQSDIDPHFWDPPKSFSERLSPDVTLIKEESEDIYPVPTLPSAAQRKRSFPHFPSKSSTPSKVQRLHDCDNIITSQGNASTSGTTNNASYNSSNLIMEPVNESLMSIIGTDNTGEVEQADVSIHNINSNDVPSLIDISQGDRVSAAPSSFDTTSVPSTCRGDNSATNSRPTDGNDRVDESDRIRLHLLSSIEARSDPVFLYPNAYPPRLSQEAVRRRVLQKGSPKTQQTVVNMVTVLCRLERWWWMKYNECRPVEDIPSERLDAYLAEFFTVLVRPDGQNYDVAHLSKVRSNLDRYLRDCNYPYSISKSEKFVTSQVAVKRKRQQIQKACYSENRECHNVGSSHAWFDST